jgi:hypothetical protein
MNAEITKWQMRKRKCYNKDAQQADDGDSQALYVWLCNGLAI